MERKLGLNVTYTDQSGNIYPAIISKLNDDGSVNLTVFTSENDGFRDDQININYANPSSLNTWNNIA